MQTLIRSIAAATRRSPAALRRFMELESAGGILMMGAAAIAFLIANSPLGVGYAGFVSAPVTLGFGESILALPLKAAVKDLLMVLFFLAVGMELKREMMIGVLKERDQVVLPLIAAAGGMAAPALIYIVAAGGPETGRGWAIPSATDIAFALAVLLIFARNFNPALKIFLLAIAIFDDLGAILIIAVFYSSGISLVPLLLAAGVVGAMAYAGRRNIGHLQLYAVLGILLAFLFHEAGLHTTLAGVVTGLMIPMAASDRSGGRPLDRAMHLVHPLVTYGVLPLFAFVSAGVSLTGLSLSHIFAPVPIAIVLGLFIGKQVGVMGATMLAVRTGLARLPPNTRMIELYAVSVLAGIGFTMSLFIGYLAFSDPLLQEEARLGVLLGSLISAIWGAVVLQVAGRGAASASSSEQRESSKTASGQQRAQLPG